jgi:hypothetical protein
MADVLAVSTVEVTAWPFATGAVRTSLLRPARDDKSVGEYDLAGTSWIATRPPETMACPVVPAGMSDVATTAAVVVPGATVEPFPFFDAPSTLAYAIALPAMNRITPIKTNMTVCLFTELPLFAAGGQRAGTRSVAGAVWFQRRV